MKLRTGRLTWRQVNDELVVLDVESSSYLSANTTAAVLMKRLAVGDASLDDLVAALLAEFEIDPPTAREDVNRFVAELEKDGLLDRDA